MSIIEDIEAEQGKPTQCQVCLWLANRPKAEQTEWDSALADRTYQHAAIFRAMTKHKANVGGKPVGRSAVENHRNNGHRR